MNIINNLKENIFSFITATVAIIAIFQTSKQLKTSNKQFLFNKRIENYLIFYGIYELYMDNIKLLDYSDEKSDEAIIVDIQFSQLTNNSYLKDITKIINNPKNNDYKTEFLIKLEDMKRIATEISFLFKNKYGLALHDFIVCYQNVLLEMYKYQILSDMMRNNNEQSFNNKTYKELQKEYGELNHRTELYKSLDNLKASYIKIIDEKIIDKIKKEMRL